MCPLRGGGMRVRQTLSASAERAADRRHIHVHVYVFECMYTHTHACIHTHIHIDMHVHAIYILAGCKDCMRMPWLEGSVLEELLREPRVQCASQCASAATLAAFASVSVWCAAAFAYAH